MAAPKKRRLDSPATSTLGLLFSFEQSGAVRATGIYPSAERLAKYDLARAFLDRQSPKIAVRVITARDGSQVVQIMVFRAALIKSYLGAILKVFHAYHGDTGYPGSEEVARDFDEHRTGETREDTLLGILHQLQAAFLRLQSFWHLDAYNLGRLSPDGGRTQKCIPVQFFSVLSEHDARMLLDRFDADADTPCSLAWFCDLFGRSSFQTTQASITATYPLVKWSTLTTILDEVVHACEISHVSVHDPLICEERLSRCTCGDVSTSSRRCHEDVDALLRFAAGELPRDRLSETQRRAVCTGHFSQYTGDEFNASLRRYREDVAAVLRFAAGELPSDQLSETQRRAVLIARNNSAAAGCYLLDPFFAKWILTCHPAFAKNYHDVLRLVQGQTRDPVLPSMRRKEKTAIVLETMRGDPALSPLARMGRHSLFDPSLLRAIFSLVDDTGKPFDTRGIF